MALIYKKGAQSAVATGQKNLDTMIDWLAMFQYSTPLILAKLLETPGKTSEARLRNRLVNGGWATLVPTPGGTAGFRIRTREKGKKATTSTPYLLVPTEQALALARSRSVHTLPPKFTSRKAGDYIHHDLCAQSFIAGILPKSSTKIWEPLSVHCLPRHAQKRYDAAIRNDAGYIGIEVERSRKDPDRELFDAFDAISRSLTGLSFVPNESAKEPVKFIKVFYLFEDEKLQKLYLKYFKRWCAVKDEDGEQPNIKYLVDPDYMEKFRFLYRPEFANERWS